MTLDGDSLLFFKVHGVKDLIFHISGSQCVGYLQHSVRQGTLTVVDMCNDAKVSCFLHRIYINGAKITNYENFSVFLFESISKVTDREIKILCSECRYEEAFNGIVESYTERLYWHVRRMLCTHEDTNDMMQEIFIKIWKALPDFRGDSGLYTWLYRVATNETLNRLRKKKINAVMELDSIGNSLASKIDDDPYFCGTDLQRELHKAIQKLPDKQKAVFCLRYFDEMKYEDIAEITGTSVGALKASYHHAYNKVREYLESIFL